MKAKNKFYLSHLILCILYSNTGFANDSAIKSTENQQSNKTSSNHQQSKIAPNLRANVSQMPFYVPPLRGAPSNRVGGGTRSSKSNFSIQALSPEHTGLTLNPQPLLYFFLSGEKNTLLELTIVANDAEEALIVNEFHSTDTPLQFIDLKSLNVQLVQDIEYQWYITIVTDPKQRARDIVSAGAIKYVSTSKKLHQTLAQANQDQKAKVLANAGIWYDAINATQTTPGINSQLQALLDQVGLSK